MSEEWESTYDQKTYTLDIKNFKMNMGTQTQ
jgi:hypothetical protein